MTVSGYPILATSFATSVPVGRVGVSGCNTPLMYSLSSWYTSLVEIVLISTTPINSSDQKHISEFPTPKIVLS